MSRYPTSAKAIELAKEGDKYYFSSRRKEAIDYYNQTLSLEPDCVYALVQRGLALQEEGQLEAAVKDYEKAIQLDPDYGPAYYGRGWAKDWMKDFAGELEDAQKGLGLDSQNPGMYLRRIGAAFSGLKRYEESVGAYSQAISLNPNDEGTIYNRGICYLLMGRNQLAVEDFDRALVLDPDWAWAFYHRGIAHEQLGNLDQAMSDVNSCLKYDPNYQLAAKAVQRLNEKMKPATSRPNASQSQAGEKKSWWKKLTG